MIFKIKLRATTDAILINAARDLRTKADSVVRAFNHRITNIDEACRKLETELTDVCALNVIALLKIIPLKFVCSLSEL